MILPSSASVKKKGDEGYNFGDKISAMRKNQLEKFRIKTVNIHTVKVDGEERTVFCVVPSSNG